MADIEHEFERKNKIKDLTSLMVHKHYCENDSEFIIDLMDKDITWLGTAEHESAEGIEKVSGIFRQFEDKVPKCNVYQEEYSVQKIMTDAYLCSGKMWIATLPETNINLRVHQRITTAFRWYAQGPKCCHIHISNPYEDMVEGDIGFPVKMSKQSYTYFNEQIEEQKRLIEAQIEELKRKSYEDLHTGVYNRNKFVEIVKCEHKIKKVHLGVAYFDLNGLKIVNDLQGHVSGDRLICNMASLLWSIFEGKVYRLGGDEFIVLDYDLNEEDFKKAVFKAKKNLEDNGINFSVGISWRSFNNSIQEQFEEADRFMYDEKRHFYEVISIKEK